MSNQYQGHIVTSNLITIITDDDTLTVPASHIAYEAVKEALLTEEYGEAVELADATRTINTFGEGLVYVQEGVVFYNGHEMHNALTRRISSMVQEGFSVGPLVNFLNNLMENPSGRAVKELYRFLECNQLPITPDGHFLAYKNVNEDYMDRHSRTFDNSVGSVCVMPRNEVMDDPNQTCSAGLHFCSIEYLKGFWGSDGHTMVVKIHPADVVSIPVDYNNSKGRCCAYEVIAEHYDGTEDTLSHSSVSNVGYHNKRDSYGRFVA
jgi:hypothetical protein